MDTIFGGSESTPTYYTRAQLGNNLGSVENILQNRRRALLWT